MRKELSRAKIVTKYNVPSAKIDTSVQPPDLPNGNLDTKINIPDTKADSGFSIKAPAISTAVDMSPLEAKADSGIDLDLDLPELPLKDNDIEINRPETSAYIDIKDKRGGIGLPNLPDVRLPSFSFGGAKKSIDIGSVKTNTDGGISANVEQPVVQLNASSVNSPSPTWPTDLKTDSRITSSIITNMIPE